MEKKCFKCGLTLPISSFYKHSMMKDGHLNKCKECTKKDNNENRKKNIDYYREYDRQRGCLEKRVLARNAYQLTTEGKKAVIKAKTKWLANNKKKRHCHAIVSYAKRIGAITKQKCELCGDDKSFAHHDDYDKPLSIRWLCAKHHREWHKENGEGKNPK